MTKIELYDLLEKIKCTNEAEAAKLTDTVCVEVYCDYVRTVERKEI